MQVLIPRVFMATNIDAVDNIMKIMIMKVWLLQMMIMYPWSIDCDMGSPNMEEGSTFPSMDAFRLVIKQYEIRGI